MILCVDMNALPKSAEVQKDVNLEDLLNNHTKYYESVGEALDDEYVPLDFSVSVRSIYSNLVLETDMGEKKVYYTNLANITPFIHKGYDLIMFLTSIGLMHNVDYKLGFDELMTKHSQFVPIGIYNPDPLTLNPIIYSHIIMSDEGAKELPQYLKADRRLVPISDIQSVGNLPALLRTFIEVKETEDEPSNNN